MQFQQALIDGAEFFRRKCTEIDRGPLLGFRVVEVAETFERREQRRVAQSALDQRTEAFWVKELTLRNTVVPSLAAWTGFSKS